MTLFIACLLIYHSSMEWWWYPVAVAIWGLHLIPAVQRWTGVRPLH